MIADLDGVRTLLYAGKGDSLGRAPWSVFF